MSTHARYFDLFGRIVSIVHQQGRWQAYDVGAEGKRRPADFQIPDFVEADELLQYLDDLFHEDATPRHPAVVEMPPPAP
ncbi:hypothetical protein LA03_15935 [Burkholderia gladioli]|uniref:DUF7661 family protein n=1 Tax=Burkholderia gladioli TaxID=28095 RepID=UPI00050EA50E|nr:hypothetical protein [Burkholderia gladioli]KGE09422.1 hypothetical protein LA03_15935 [Burkholderia gladioli]